MCSVCCRIYFETVNYVSDQKYIQLYTLSLVGIYAPESYNLAQEL